MAEIASATLAPRAAPARPPKPDTQRGETFGQAMSATIAQAQPTADVQRGDADAAGDEDRIAPDTDETMNPAIAAILALLEPRQLKAEVATPSPMPGAPAAAAAGQVPVLALPVAATRPQAAAPAADPAKIAAAQAALAALTGAGGAADAAPAETAQIVAKPQPAKEATGRTIELARDPAAKAPPPEAGKPAATPTRKSTPTLHTGDASLPALAPSIDGKAPVSAQAADATQVAAQPTGADQAVGTALADARTDQWLDQLARDIARTGGGESRLSFTLDPAQLGPVAVHIAQDSDGASVRMSARDDQTRTILTDAQPRLVAEARAQGLTLRETSVDVGGQGSGNPSSGTQQQGGHRSGTAHDASAFGQSGGQPGGGQADQRRSSPDRNTFTRMVPPARANAAQPGGDDARYA